MRTHRLGRPFVFVAVGDVPETTAGLVVGNDQWTGWVDRLAIYWAGWDPGFFPMRGVGAPSRALGTLPGTRRYYV